tara:strand:- start:22349 stop:23026 length:678 start_codon:yes stop_codon:yes gene_type:complete
MFNTKDMQVGSGKVRPLMGPGNEVVRVNSITFDKTPYDAEAFNINLHMETKPIGGDFEGFFMDKDNESKGRYQGQIGRVRMTPFPYKSTTLASGREIDRDQEILKSMIFLSEVMNKRAELDAIEAATIEAFVDSCSKIFSGTYFNVCLGSREWENKEGYTNNDLYLPKLSKAGIPAEALDAENSRLIVFDSNDHVRKLVKKEPVASSNGSFQAKATGTVGSDFDL